MDTREQSGRVDALVLGSITRDFVADEEGPRPGGVVFYAGMALARLGARVRVATRVRPEDAEGLLGPLEAERVETLALPSRATTSYALDYRGREDAHELVHASDPLRADDLPPAWRRADLIQLGPLHPRDLDPDLPAALDGFVGLDLQGLLRSSEKLGLRRPEARDLVPLLSQLHVVQASEQELPAILEGDTPEAFARRYGLRELIVTRGARGAVVITSAGAEPVAAARARGHKTIGAGDVFLAVYLLERTRGRGPVDAARAASRATAAKIDHGQIPKGFRMEPACG